VKKIELWKSYPTCQVEDDQAGVKTFPQLFKIQNLKSYAQVAKNACGNFCGMIKGRSNLLSNIFQIFYGR